MAEVVAREAGLQQGDDLGDRPVGHSRFGPRSQRRGIPVLAWQLAAAEVGADGDGAQQVARGVAGIAMGETAQQVFAAVPLWRAIGAGAVVRRAKEQHPPARQGELRIEREVQRMGTVLIRRRR